MNHLHPQAQFCNHKNLSNASIQTVIRADLIGSNTCTAAGVTVVDHARCLRCVARF
jgi:hypothetical protein